MTSGFQHQKTFVQTRDKNNDIQFVPFLFQFLIGHSISTEKVRQKRNFCFQKFFSIFEIIKLRRARKVRRYYLWQLYWNPWYQLSSIMVGPIVQWLLSAVFCWELKLFNAYFLAPIPTFEGLYGGIIFNFFRSMSRYHLYVFKGCQGSHL
jgi:hypothetical protein